MWEVYHRVTGNAVERFDRPQDAMDFALRSPAQYAYEYVGVAS